MSRSRLIVSMVTIICLLLFTGRLMVGAFPLQTLALLAPPMPPQAAQPGPFRVAREVAQANLEHQIRPLYPPEAKQLGIQGEVNLDVTINQKGEVSNIRVINGHPLLIMAALDAVKQWRYSTAMSLPAITQVKFNFKLAQLGEAESSVGTSGQENAMATSDPFLRKWLEQDACYIATEEEKTAFQGLLSDKERYEFIERFWLRRDSNPATVENEFRDEYYRRIAYANERFASTQPGWKTDRGRIYITYGPPDQVEAGLAPRGSEAGWAPAIPEGQRVLSIRADEIIGGADYVLPGSRVDVVLTASPLGAAAAVTTKLLQNQEVVSTGQVIQKDEESRPKTVSVVTLLVTPEEAEKLIAASSQGQFQIEVHPSSNAALSYPYEIWRYRPFAEHGSANERVFEFVGLEYRLAMR